MVRSIAAALACALLVQDPSDAVSEKSKLHEELAVAAEGTGDQLIKLKSWDEARAFLELIRAKSDARSDALDKLIAKTDKQTSGLKWDSKSSDLIKSFGSERAKKFFAFARAWKEKDPEAARWTQAEGEILDDLLDYVKAYARLTQIRAHYELPKTRFDWKLSVPAVWHAEYKRLNPNDGKELEDNEGYTREGKKAGECSITSRGESITDQLEGIVHGPFHRTMILNPSLMTTGFGQSKGPRVGSVVDVLSGLKQAESFPKPLAIPSNNSTDVPPAGFDDNIQIVKDRSSKEMGYPISLTFFDPAMKPTNVKATLQESLKSVDFYLSTPEEPAIPKRYPNNRNSILLIPKNKLQTNTAYKVKITCLVQGDSATFEWEFRTAH